MSVFRTTVVLMAATLGLLRWATDAKAENLVLNPGFETYTNNDPADADIWNNDSYPSHQARSNARARSGAYSLKLFTANTDPASTDIRQDVYINPAIWGQPYEFSLFVLNPADAPLTGASFRVYLRPRKADNTILETLITNTITSATPTEEWTKLTLSGVVPQDTQRFLIELVGAGLKTTSTQALYLDDVSLMVVPEPSTLAQVVFVGLVGLGFWGWRRARRSPDGDAPA